MSISERFLVALILIFSLPWLVWRLGRTEHWAPLVVVQIVAGILLGPGVLGAMWPGYYAAIFTPEVIGALNGVAWWAVMIFVWIAGIELDPRQAWAKRGESVTAAAFALGGPLVLGSLAALVLLRWPGWVGPAGTHWQVVAGIGMACAVTALPILVLFMDKLAILREPLGQRILRYASLDDIAIWGVLALILLDWGRLGRQVAFLAVFALATIAIRRIMRAIPPKDRWYLGLLWLAASGWAADWSGLHFMVGAFLSGAVLDADLFDRAAMDRFRDNILLAIMPVFFLSTGLRTAWTLGGGEVFAAAALLLAASVGGKLGGVHIAGRLLGWRRGEASAIGWLLQTKALIMIIFAQVLLDKRIITADAFTALLLMAVASTMLTIPIVTPRLRRLAAAAPAD